MEPSARDNGRRHVELVRLNTGRAPERRDAPERGGPEGQGGRSHAHGAVLGDDAELRQWRPGPTRRDSVEIRRAEGSDGGRASGRRGGSVRWCGSALPLCSAKLGSRGPGEWDADPSLAEPCRSQISGKQPDCHDRERLSEPLEHRREIEAGARTDLRGGVLRRSDLGVELEQRREEGQATNENAHQGSKARVPETSRHHHHHRRFPSTVPASSREGQDRGQGTSAEEASAKASGRRGAEEGGGQRAKTNDERLPIAATAAAARSPSPGARRTLGEVRTRRGRCGPTPQTGKQSNSFSRGRGAIAKERRGHSQRQEGACERDP